MTLGILIGDLLLILLGHGTWQAAVVLFLTVIIARFIDKGIIFTIQLSSRPVSRCCCPYLTMRSPAVSTVSLVAPLRSSPCT